ncbi:hypothetical protein [Burkholderia territorii]|uniref:hypothetical protein n=1 Tax=Burkholderia territorii TaxID=1503055 RepID=UPI000AE34EB9|nr:hypothetical protein [Burkholderia territorii]
MGTVIGYPLGFKVEGKLNNVLNPWYRQEWVDIGMGVSKYVPPSMLPSWFGGAARGAAQEKMAATMQNKLDGAGVRK